MHLRSLDGLPLQFDDTTRDNVTRPAKAFGTPHALDIRDLMFTAGSTATPRYSTPKPSPPTHPSTSRTLSTPSIGQCAPRCAAKPQVLPALFADLLGHPTFPAGPILIANLPRLIGSVGALITAHV